MNDAGMSSSKFVHTAELQIARTVHRGQGRTWAEFSVPGPDGDWFCLNVFKHYSDDYKEWRMQLRTICESPSEAKAVEVAISMALDWIAEQDAT